MRCTHVPPPMMRLILPCPHAHPSLSYARTYPHTYPHTTCPQVRAATVLSIGELATVDEVVSR